MSSSAMLSGPHDTATPKRAAPSSPISEAIARISSSTGSPSPIGASGGTLGPGPALVHHAAQTGRQGRTIDLLQFRIDLACVSRLLELDQRLAQIGQAVGRAVALGTLLIIFIEGDRRERRLAI